MTSSKYQHLLRMICIHATSKFFAWFVLHAAPELLSPYSALAISITISCSVPNYMPDSVQIFSLLLALRYALPISHANIYNSFKEASRNAILTLSLDTTLEYVIDDDGSGVWPLATNLTFLVNFPFILILYIMCTLTCSYPGLISPFLI